jgi:SAM-dependent methyltransferase
LRYIRPTSTDSLLDLGCGSGRLICFAAPFSFSRIIGVELNPGLAAIAARNNSSLRGCAIAVHPEVVCADAADFQVPDDIFWTFNPFRGEVYRATLTYNPRQHDLVTSVGQFRQTDALRVWWWPSADNKRFRMIAVYEVAAA